MNTSNYRTQDLNNNLLILYEITWLYFFSGNEDGRTFLVRREAAVDAQTQEWNRKQNYYYEILSVIRYNDSDYIYWNHI